MSEKGGDNSGTQTHTESENVLDDLMQNNVQFDEDEKPKTVSFCQDSIGNYVQRTRKVQK